VFALLGAVSKHLNKYPAKYTRAMTFPTPNKHFGYLRQWYLNLTTLSFCGHPFPAIRDYDAYLSFKYGDYMKLPPPEKRHWHPAEGIRFPEDY
jgi:lipopolysaccharide cholinephosphotransferase